MTRRISELADAAACRDTILARTSGRRPVVFLDYDGTLTPIVDRPEAAVLSERTREIVRALSERCPVAIVTGRERADVEQRVGLDTVIYVGDHGLDIASPRDPTVRHCAGERFLPLLGSVAERLRSEIGGIPGCQIESKSFSVAVHYRRVDPAEHGRIAAAVAAVLAENPQLHATPGKMIFEVLPRIDWNKGRAILYLLEKLHLDDDRSVPFFFGDDITDEDGFRALDGKGIGIVVRDLAAGAEDRPTDAAYRLRDPAAVVAFIDTLAR